MDKLDKLYRLHHLLAGRRVPIPRADLLRELESSWPTLKRLIRDLRERFNAPIVPVRGQGYVYDLKAGKMFELPGLWFNAEELLALVTIDELLKRLQPGLLDEQLAPLRAWVEKLLASEHLGAGEAGRRIRILRMTAGPASCRIFWDRCRRGAPASVTCSSHGPDGRWCRRGLEGHGGGTAQGCC
jgi:proteasome accessory factor C